MRDRLTDRMPCVDVLSYGRAAEVKTLYVLCLCFTSCVAVENELFSKICTRK